MNIDHVPEELVELCLRAQRVCVEIQQVRRQLQATRQQTQALIMHAHDLHPDDAWPHLSARAAIEPSDLAALPAAPRVLPKDPSAPRPAQTDPDPLAEAKRALRMIAAILREFPLETQVEMVKALTARTMVHVQEQLQTPTVLSA